MDENELVFDAKTCRWCKLLWVKIFGKKIKTDRVTLYVYKGEYYFTRIE